MGRKAKFDETVVPSGPGRKSKKQSDPTFSKRLIEKEQATVLSHRQKQRARKRASKRAEKQNVGEPGTKKAKATTTDDDESASEEETTRQPGAFVRPLPIDDDSSGGGEDTSEDESAGEEDDASESEEDDELPIEKANRRLKKKQAQERSAADTAFGGFRTTDELLQIINNDTDSDEDFDLIQNSSGKKMIWENLPQLSGYIL